jgi:hypothetical protein
LFSLPGFCVFGQGREFFQLEYHDKQGYKESNTFFRDSVWRFNQTVAFDLPNTLDEEFWKTLVLKIKDTSSFLKNKLVSLPNDISKIKYEFDTRSSVSAFDFPPTDSTSISGTITLLHSTNDNILLKLDLEIKNLRSLDRYYYKGEREFRRTHSFYEFYRNGY